MLYKGTMNDLRDAGKKAKDLIKSEELRHVVYAYASKEFPEQIIVLDWKPLKFKTDSEFESYVKEATEQAEMIYAVHAL